jgi:hypothetical protein
MLIKFWYFVRNLSKAFGILIILLLIDYSVSQFEVKIIIYVFQAALAGVLFRGAYTFTFDEDFLSIGLDHVR